MYQMTPDIVDLQTWMVLSNDPFVKKMWEATKYLSAPYELWVATWKEVGSPDLEEFFLK
jgi:hypothetical protein